jgi:NADPH:quinone reductase-like Zn-dependent oxidoreductase
VAGVVEEVGYGVTRFALGDRVFGMPWFPRQAGGYAEYITAPSRQLCAMPATLSFTEAAALPLAGLTALQMLVDAAEITPGQKVLIAGAAGGVGHLAVQIAKAHGAYVIGTASAAKHGFLAELGVDEAVDYTARPVHQMVHDVDVVIQMFGGEAGLSALQCLRPGGVMVSAQAAWTPGVHERARELGVRACDYLVEPDGAGLQVLSRLVDSGQVLVHVAARPPLADAARAQRLIADGHTFGKIVFEID